MKKIIVSFVVLIAFKTSNAQLGDLAKKASSVASASGFNVNSSTNSIMGQLTNQLSLTKDQQPKVSSAVTSFLTEKAKILPLQNTNTSAYNNKFGGLFNGLKGKLAGILLQNQMNKFLGLRPAKPTVGNVLSQLFF
jgi:hypothetical protein